MQIKIPELLIIIFTCPIKYGLPASPNKCEIKICTASAAERLVGITTYCKETINNGNEHAMVEN